MADDVDKESKTEEATEKKVRDTIEVPADADEAGVRELARASAKARRAIGDRDVAKEIVRAPKLVNFVTR